MKSKEVLTNLFCEANRFSCEEPKFTTHNLWEMCNQIEKDLEVLEILKNRIHLKEDTLTIDSPVFSNFNEITSEKKNTDIAWIEASGFVFRNSNEYRLLKEWAEEK